MWSWEACIMLLDAASSGVRWANGLSGRALCWCCFVIRCKQSGSWLVERFRCIIFLSTWLISVKLVGNAVPTYSGRAIRPKSARGSCERAFSTECHRNMETKMAYWKHMFQENSRVICTHSGYLQLVPLWKFHLGCGCVHSVYRAPCELKQHWTTWTQHD